MRAVDNWHDSTILGSLDPQTGQNWSVNFWGSAFPFGKIGRFSALKSLGSGKDSEKQ